LISGRRDFIPTGCISDLSGAECADGAGQRVFSGQLCAVPAVAGAGGCAEYDEFTGADEV